MALLELPADILELIVDELISNAPEPLFAPIYEEEDKVGDMGNLAEKCVENYGKREEDHLQSAQALLDWSSTCRHFRKLLSPRVFKSVILRSKPKSMASIKALMKTPHWAQIDSFIFAATEHEYDEDGERELGEYGSKQDDEVPFTNTVVDGESKYNLDIEISEIRAVLSNLPPNLKSLTLDFPNGWSMEWSDIISGNVSDGEDPETGERYRRQLQTAVEAVSSYDISTKAEFELKLLSVPPVLCDAYETDAWHQFLSKVTSFTVALFHWDNGAGWNMNVYQDEGDAADLAKELSNYFLNHLKRAKRLRVYGDNSWPLGISPDDINQVDVTLPTDATLLPALEHVSFKEFFISETLQDFIVQQLPNLRSIDLTDCFAAGYYDLEEDQPLPEPNWATFFTAIANAKPKNLTEITIKTERVEFEHLIKGYDHGEKKDDDPIVTARNEVRDILAAQEAEIATIPNPARQRLLLTHVSVDDKYGMIFDQEEVNVDIFLKQTAHKQWLRIVDIMEENKKRGPDVNVNAPVSKERASQSKGRYALRERR